MKKKPSVACDGSGKWVRKQNEMTGEWEEKWRPRLVCGSGTIGPMLHLDGCDGNHPDPRSVKSQMLTQQEIEGIRTH